MISFPNPSFIIMLGDSNVLPLFCSLRFWLPITVITVYCPVAVYSSPLFAITLYDWLKLSITRLRSPLLGFALHYWALLSVTGLRSLLPVINIQKTVTIRHPRLGMPLIHRRGAILYDLIRFTVSSSVFISARRSFDLSVFSLDKAAHTSFSFLICQSR